MANSSAVIEIGKYIDGYIIKRKLTQEDYFVYLKYACDCFRMINIRHSNEVITAKVSVSSLGIVEMPDDMISGGFIAVPIDGKFWTFTVQSRKVNTTTTTLGVEGQDSAMGEGVDIKDDQYIGIGGRGGVNAYYVTTDWNARRLFCDGFKSDTAVLRYTSSGLVVNGSTYVPTKCEMTLDSYIDWQREVTEPRSMSMIQYLEGVYKDRLLELRLINFMPSLDEIKDAWDSSSTLAVQR